MITETTRQALSILRDPATLQWYLIPLLALLFYIYTIEVQKRDWNIVLAGLSFWGMDWINEIWNSLVLHFTQFAPVWGAPGKTAYLILAGLNIEICFMFAISGIIWCKMLPVDGKIKILGMPNRWFFAIAGSIFCVIIEVILNAAGMLTWEYAWWSRSVPWLVFLIGYLPFFAVSFWVYDMKKIRSKLTAVGVIWTIILVSLVIFIPVLHWI
jgi:hypothetical protein